MNGRCIIYVYCPIFSHCLSRTFYQLLSLSFRDMDNIKLNEKQELFGQSQNVQCCCRWFCFPSTSSSSLFRYKNTFNHLKNIDEWVIMCDYHRFLYSYSSNEIAYYLMFISQTHK